MNIADWKDLNGQFIKTNNEKEIVVRIEKPTMEQLKNLLDLSEWDIELMDYFNTVVVNDYGADRFSWMYLISDDGISMTIRLSKDGNRAIAFSEEYSDKWEQVEWIEFRNDREEEVSYANVKIPSEKEPIELYMS